MSDPWGIGRFVAGCIMIPFALVLLWKNEKKLVTYAKCMEKARADCTNANNKDLSEANNFKLVHTSGKSENKTELVDNEFGIVAENSYRLKRIVEMYQWRQEKITGKDGAPDRYTYSQQWCSSPIDSSNFNESGHENPGTNWPFQSVTVEAQHVTLGDYKLNASQVSRLGRHNTKKSEVSDDHVGNTADNMSNCGFSEFQVRGNYLVASTSDNSLVGEHVGQYRVCFEYDTCGTTTIIAQQMQDDEEVFTFRKWNPDKINVPMSESTDAEGDSALCSNPMCCYICMCVNCLFNTMFEEVVDHATDSQVTSEYYFDD